MINTRGMITNEHKDAVQFFINFGFVDRCFMLFIRSIMVSDCLSPSHVFDLVIDDRVSEINNLIKNAPLTNCDYYSELIYEADSKDAFLNTINKYNILPDCWKISNDVLYIVEVTATNGICWNRLVKYGVIEDLLFYKLGLKMVLLELKTTDWSVFWHEPRYSFDHTHDMSDEYLKSIGFDKLSDAAKLRKYYRDIKSPTLFFDKAALVWVYLSTDVNTESESIEKLIEKVKIMGSDLLW